MQPLSVTWENFRGFGRATTFHFPKFTVLIGRNNVGKTSAYTPLLAMRQTLEARDPRTALLGRGSLVDIGQFKDYVTGHDTSRTVGFTVRFPEPEELYGRTLQVGGLSVEFGTPDGNSARLQRHRVLDARGRAVISRSLDQDGDAYTVTSQLLPPNQSVGRPPREIAQLRKGMRQEAPKGFLFNGFGALIVPRSWRQDEERWEKARPWYSGASDMFDTYSIVNREIVGLLNSISYLGPLRSLPLRTYRMAAEPPPDVGREGEHAPEILYGLDAGEEKARVSQWLQKLGYGELEFEGFGEEYFRLNLRTSSGLLVNFAHSGIGLSQLLPLLVQGVALESGATFIAQQPEIHLNPAQQSVVTDFLIEVASTAGRVVVETHSEHVLLRLRLRMAEDPHLNSEDVALYFFDNREGRTVVERIPVGDQGEIERDAWPRGFFEEQLKDSLAMALAQSRGTSVA